MTFWDQTVIELFRKGGFAMWPLLFCSVVGTAIVMERFFYFRKISLDYPRFSEDLKALLSGGRTRDAVEFCRKSASPISQIAEVYLQNLSKDSLRNEVLKREGSFALEKVEGRLRGLAFITHVAPLLGLLGTVTGLVAAFHRIETLGGQVQPGDLAAGIWEALLTTVFGLMIAIPCMAAYHHFETVADKIARRMQFIVSELDEFFGKRSAGGFKSEDPEGTEAEMKAVS